jgi:hypothetical protein
MHTVTVVVYAFDAASFACAVSTVSFSVAITFSGWGSLKIAVPATITLLPAIVSSEKKQ